MSNRLRSLTTSDRYTKQRKYNLNTDLVVKFIPRSLAIVLASVILFIKPVEAEFARNIYGTNPLQTQEFLYTVQGAPVEAETMNSIMSETFAEYGMQIHMSDLRHALEAFAHKIGKGPAQYDPFLTRTANHNIGTSATYGRDENSIIGIPADMTEANAERYAAPAAGICIYAYNLVFSCDRWNNIVLKRSCKKLGEGMSATDTGVNAPQAHAEAFSFREMNTKESCGNASQRHESTSEIPNAASGMSIEYVQLHQEDGHEENQKQRAKCAVTNEYRGTILRSPDLKHVVQPQHCNLEHSEQLVGMSITDNCFLKMFEEYDSDVTTAEKPPPRSKLDLQSITSTGLTTSESSLLQPRPQAFFDNLRTCEVMPRKLNCVMAVASQDLDEKATQKIKNGRSTAQIDDRRKEAIKRLKLMEELRPFQREALATIESAQHHAIIIMPTGSGKTALIWSYKPKDTCSVIFAPFKILVEQLGAVLATKGKVVSYPFVSNDGDLFAIRATADFIICPYETAPTLADFISALNELGRMGPIWVDEVHNLTTTGRFRHSLDSFWNLQAQLQTSGLKPKMIGLTATLRPDDVSDVMRRMSVAHVDLFRRSCHRAELDLRFLKPFKQEIDMIQKACQLTTEFAGDGRVMVITSTVNLCDIMADQIQSKFSG